MSRPPISTHILDISQGHPASGVLVKLYKEDGSTWQLINSEETSPDGRCTAFVTKEGFEAGTYKFKFEVGKYFERNKIATLYPHVEIVFKCSSIDEHYHIPLLLSPFGYSTYRGS